MARSDTTQPCSPEAISRFVYSQIILIHYHEVGLKGRNRARFERQLQQNIQTALDDLGSLSVSRISGRLLIEENSDLSSDMESIATIVSAIPGVVRVSRGVCVSRDLDIINDAALSILKQSEPFVSFKVAARRANTEYPLDSMQLNQIVGAYLSLNLPNKIVRMTNPDVKLHLEIIENRAFIYAHTIKGIGGLPVGSSGTVVCLLSAGLDSPVAAWRMMRRGATVLGLHFSGRPQTSADSEHLVQQIAQVLKPIAGLKSLYVVAFGEYQRLIAATVPTSLRILFYRRLMFSVANRLAAVQGARALVTGESLGQVASQTLENIQVIDAVAEYPVLRPLIGSDKQEIITEAQRLGTYEISIQNHQDCCTLFMPRNPETHARLSIVESIWNQLPINEWLDTIMADIEELDLD